jgi:acetolactate synthase-1/2/3 large subunit
MELSGAQIMVKCLEREGTKHIFGFPGGTIMPFYDALMDSKIRHYLVRHEQGAAHAADGYARTSEKAGVCVATSGPGATNLVTGLATALMDCSPVVAITGQVACPVIGTDAFQEMDVFGLALPVTKHGYLVKDIRDLARTFKEAFHIALSGRPGPVAIDVPKDIQNQKTEFVYPDKVNLPGYHPEEAEEVDEEAVARACELIEQAERPVFLCGGGVVYSNAAPELAAFAEKIDCPVVATLHGLTALPTAHRLSLGMLGMHGSGYANNAVLKADLVINFGSRFDDRITGNLKTFAENAKVIHIDIDPSEIDKNVRADVGIVGDAKILLKKFREAVTEKKRPEWLAQIERWRKQYPKKVLDEKGGVNPMTILECISERGTDDVIVTTDVGQHQMWAAQLLHQGRPRYFVTSGGLGTMGFGLPAAVGAQIANPDKLVITITGDGSIQMNIQELATVSVNKIPVKIILMENKCLGMVRQWQELFFDKRYSCTILEGNPDFVKLAEAYGIAGARVERNADVPAAVKKCLEHDGPYMLHMVIPKETNVYPLVPSGAPYTEAIGLEDTVD